MFSKRNDGVSENSPQRRRQTKKKKKREKKKKNIKLRLFSPFPCSPVGHRNNFTHSNAILIELAENPNDREGGGRGFWINFDSPRVIVGVLDLNTDWSIP